MTIGLMQSVQSIHAAEDDWRHPFWLGGDTNKPVTNAVFRKVFKVDEKPVKCFILFRAVDRINSTGAGGYAIYINEKKVVDYAGKGVGPWCKTNWYDLSEAVVPGDNVIGVETRLGATNGNLAFYFEGDLWFDGDRREMWRSDKSWKFTPSIPADQAWNSKGFNDAGWENAREIGRKGGVPFGAAGGKNELKVPLAEIKTNFDVEFRKIVDLQLKQEKITIVPAPHQLELQADKIIVGHDQKTDLNIALAVDNAGERFAAQVLSTALEQCGIGKPDIQVFNQSITNQNRIILAGGEIKSGWLKKMLKRNKADLSDLPAESFAVFSYHENGETGFVLHGQDDAGLLYAVYTFIQLLRKNSGELSAPCGRIVDYPDTSRRGLIGWYGGNPTNIAWLSFYRFNRVFWVGNTSDPFDPQLSEFNNYIGKLGIKSVLHLHPRPDFGYTIPLHRELLWKQMEEACKHGFTEITIQDDDSVANVLPDAEVYGPGLTGTGRAQEAFMTIASRRADVLRQHLYFCPNVYGNDAPEGEAREYLRIIGKMPKEVEIWYARRSYEPLIHLPADFQWWLIDGTTHDKKTAKCNEMFYELTRRPIAYWCNESGCRGNFGEYPEIHGGRNVPRTAFTMRHAWGLYRANLLCFLNNWWNHDAPLGLKTALEKEWGPHPAGYLYRYAETIGLQTGWGPGFSWARILEPGAINLKYLRDVADRARQAQGMDWTGSGLDGKDVGQLKENAGKIEALFTLLGDWMEKKLIKAEGNGKSDERLAELQKSINSARTRLLKEFNIGSYAFIKYSQGWENIPAESANDEFKYEKGP